MKVSVHIISLEEAEKRRKSAESQLAKARIPHTLHKFKRLTDSTPTNYDSKKRLRFFGYPMLAGEIGCFDSHRKVWNLIVEQNQPALILEDDFKMLNLIAFEFLKKHKFKALEIIRCQGTFTKKTTHIRSLGFGEMVTYKGYASGALAYILTPYAAKRLLQRSNSFYVPVDDFIDQEWRHGIIVKGLLPYSFGIKDFESEIGGRSKPKLTGSKKFRVEFFKSWISIRGRVFRFKKFFHYKLKIH